MTTPDLRSAVEGLNAALREIDGAIGAEDTASAWCR